MLKTLNHPNILQFIGILYREGKVLVLITGMFINWRVETIATLNRCENYMMYMYV